MVGSRLWGLAGLAAIGLLGMGSPALGYTMDGEEKAALKDSIITRIDCEDCMCDRTIWNNCTNACKWMKMKPGDSLTKFHKLLMHIGPRCQQFADIRIPQDLQDKHWCNSTTEGREGISVQFPVLEAHNDIEAVRQETLDIYARLWFANDPSEWRCWDSDTDGYMIIPSEYTPRPDICPMNDIPARLPLMDYIKHQHSLTIPLHSGILRSRLDIDQGYHPVYALPTEVDSKVYNIRYIPNGQDQSQRCFGPVKGVTLVRHLRAWYNGREYPVHPYDLDNPEDYTNVENDTPIIRNQATTDAVQTYVPWYYAWAGRGEDPWYGQSWGWAL